jgi:hypothetical protein
VLVGGRGGVGCREAVDVGVDASVADGDELLLLVAEGVGVIVPGVAVAEEMEDEEGGNSDDVGMGVDEDGELVAVLPPVLVGVGVLVDPTVGVPLGEAEDEEAGGEGGMRVGVTVGVALEDEDGSGVPLGVADGEAEAEGEMVEAVGVAVVGEAVDDAGQYFFKIAVLLPHVQLSQLQSHVTPSEPTVWPGNPSPCCAKCADKAESSIKIRWNEQQDVRWQT